MEDRLPWGEGARRDAQDLSWRQLPVVERLKHALVAGIDEYVVADTEDHAEDAVRLCKLELDAGPVVATVEAAMAAAGVTLR